MKSIYRLKKSFQYSYVYKHAKSVADKNLVILYCTNNNKQSRVGFSVSKKYGHAVQRNRMRRQLKAALSTFMPSVKRGYNLVIVPRKNEPYLFEDILQSAKSLLVKAELLQ